MLIPRVKWQGCEADHSPPSGAEVKNVWSYTSIHHMSSWHDASISIGYVFIVWNFVKHRDNFTLSYMVLKLEGCHNDPH
jgi:hypothetical protein